jgi:hypothetical protein
MNSNKIHILLEEIARERQAMYRASSHLEGPFKESLKVSEDLIMKIDAIERPYRDRIALLQDELSVAFHYDRIVSGIKVCAFFVCMYYVSIATLQTCNTILHPRLFH